MTFWQLMLIINAIIGLIVLIEMVDTSLQVAKIIKAQNIELKKVSVFRTMLRYFAMFLKCFCPIINIFLLLGFALTDRNQIVNNTFFRIQAEREMGLNG